MESGDHDAATTSTAPGAPASADDMEHTQLSKPSTEAAAMPVWQHKLLVLCDLAREMISLGQVEPAASIAFRILELDGLALPLSSLSPPPLQQHNALVVVAALAKEFATNCQYEPAAALAQRVLKLDVGNTDARGVVRYVREKARAWSDSSRSHLPGLCIGREHADRAAYAIQSSARAQHGPRPRELRAGALNPRPGVPQQRPRGGRTIYVLPPRLASKSCIGSTDDRVIGTGKPSVLTANPPGSRRQPMADAGRPVQSDTQGGAITPQGFRSQHHARQSNMVPVSVLLRESSTPKHKTSWVVMDEAVVPSGGENADDILRQAYETKSRHMTELEYENMQLRRQAEDNSRQIETLTAQAAATAQQKSTSATFSFSKLFDIMNAKAATTGVATQLNPDADDWALPEERAIILRQLCDTQLAEPEVTSDSADRAQTFRCVFKALDLCRLGAIAKQDLMHVLKKDATIATLLRLPGPRAESDCDETNGSEEDARSTADFAHHLDQTDIDDEETIDEEQFVAMATMGLPKATKLVLERNRALSIMSERLQEAKERANKELEDATIADKTAAKELEEARRAQLVADKQNYGAMLAGQAASKEEKEAQEAALIAAREEEEAAQADQLANQEELEARQAAEIAEQEQKEAEEAKLKAEAEGADVIKAQATCETRRAALRAAQQSGDATAIAQSEAALQEAEDELTREQAEYDEAKKEAEREAAEAAAAAAVAEKEMREAKEARRQAEQEKQEAEEAARRLAKEETEAKHAREAADQAAEEARIAQQKADKESEEARIAVEIAKRERAEADEALAEVERVRAENRKLYEEMLQREEKSAEQAEHLKTVEEQILASREKLEADKRASVKEHELRLRSVWGDDEDIDDVDILHGCPTAPAAGARLLVTIVGCADVIAADSSGTSDPFCVLGVGHASTLDTLAIPKRQYRDDQFPTGGKWLRTATVDKSLDPVFDEEFSVPIPPPVQDCPLLLKIQVYDWDRIGSNDFLGEVEIDLATVIRYESGFDRTVTKSLNDRSARVPDADLKKRVDARVTRSVSCLLVRIRSIIGSSA